MPNFADRVHRLSGPGAEAWEIHYEARRRQRAGQQDIVLLTVGDPDFNTPVAIVDAAVASLRKGQTHYTDVQGIPELRAAIIAGFNRATGLSYTPAQVNVTAGAQNALFYAGMVLLQPGDEVVTLDPVYVTYEGLIAASGATMVTASLVPERGFHPDIGAIKAAIGPRTKAIMINSPHNPSGVVFTRAEMTAIAALCVEHDLWLISDEVYADLTFDGREHVCPATLPGMAERTVVVSSLSKSHAMTGWRLGWLIGPEQFAHHVHDLSLSSLYGMPTFIQQAAITAVSADLPETAMMKAAYQRRRDTAVRLLAQVPGLLCHVPESGMFVMVDVRGTGLGAEAFAQRALDHHAVAVLPCDTFGRAGVGHIRISFAGSDADVAEGCRRVAACARGLSDLR